MSEENENKEMSNEEELRQNLDSVFQAEDNPEPVAEEPVIQPAEEQNVQEAQKKEENLDEDLLDLPESNPKPDDWKVMRERYNKMKQELRDSKKTTPVPEAMIPDFSRTAPEPVKQEDNKQKYSADFLIDVLIKHEEGELDAGYKAEAEEALAKTNPRDIVEVIRKARAGFYGEKSAEVEDTARRYLPEVQANWENVKAEQQASKQAEILRSQSWNEVFTKNPELKDRNSSTYNSFKEASGVLQNTFPELWNRPNAPQIISEFVEMKNSANNYMTVKTENEKLRTKIKQLENRLGIVQGPPSQGRAPDIDENQKLSNEKQLERDLAELGFIRS